MTYADLTVLADRLANAGPGAAAINLPAMTGREFRVFLGRLRRITASGQI